MSEGNHYGVLDEDLKRLQSSRARVGLGSDENEKFPSDIVDFLHGPGADFGHEEDTEGFFREDEFEESIHGPAFPGGYLNREDYQAKMDFDVDLPRRKEFQEKLARLLKIRDKIFNAGGDDCERNLSNLERDIDNLIEEYDGNIVRGYN